MSIFKELKEWREVRHLDKIEYNHYNHVKCIAEELFELMDYRGVLKDNALQEFMLEFYQEVNDMDIILDASCDNVIYNINFIEQAKYDASKCLNETIKEINSRVGEYKPEVGKFVKDKSDEAQSKWYNANYSVAKYNIDLRD